MTVQFHTPDSLLPLVCITTFGVSVKENAHPIGYFGTGLKYAIAVLLREGCEIEIIVGDDKYEFYLDEVEIRGKGFRLVKMKHEKDGETTITNLPFTTELGKNWQLWQAYRELWSNCVDEKGEVLCYKAEHTGIGTVINVTGEAFDEINRMENRERFILATNPKYVLNDVEIHEVWEGQVAGVFYKGIRVLTLPTKFTYNLLGDHQLTEDRTMSQWDAEYTITGAISETNNIDALTDILSITEDNYHESHFNFSKYRKPSESFMKLAAKLKEKSHVVSHYFEHWSPQFLGVLPKDTLSRKVKRQLAALKSMFKRQPEDIYVMSLPANDYYRIVNKIVCVDPKIMNNNDKLGLVYAIAMLKLKKSGDNRSDIQIVVDELSKYFKWPEGMD